MTNSLLFNNIRYNKFINRNNIKPHPHKDLFINVFLLFIFIISIALFLSYRYKCKKDNLIIEEEKEQLQEKIEEEKIEQEKNIEEKKNEYIEETTEKNIKKNNDIFINDNSLEDEKYYLIN